MLGFDCQAGLTDFGYVKGLGAGYVDSAGALGGFVVVRVYFVDWSWMVEFGCEDECCEQVRPSSREWESAHMLNLFLKLLFRNGKTTIGH